MTGSAPKVLTEDDVAVKIDWDALWATARLRKDRPWVYDIIRVLWSRQGLGLFDIYDAVREMRDPTDLPKPKAFKETIRRTIYDHSSNSKGWDGKDEDDLFYSVRRGQWAVRKDRAAAWVRQHQLHDA